MMSQDPPPPPILKVLCFGDSLTAGYTSKNEYFPYARYLEQHLEAYYASKSSSSSGGGGDAAEAANYVDAKGDDIGISDTSDSMADKAAEDTNKSMDYDSVNAIVGSRRSIRVDKIGMSGWTTLEMVLGMDDYENIDCFGKTSHGLGYHLSTKGPYNFAFILAGTNDIGEGVSSKKIAANIESLVDCCLTKSDSIKVGVILVPPCGAEINNKRIADDRAALNSYIRSLPTAYKEGADRSIFVVDCLKELPNDRSDETLWDWDTLHLSSFGSEVLGKVVFEHMLKYL